MSGPGGAPQLVLASGSPRRAAVLEQLGLSFQRVIPEVQEERRVRESAGEAAERLARRKAEAVRRTRPDALVVAGDTMVVSGAEILEKPADEEDAVAVLLRLSGRSHRVVTALALAPPGNEVLSGVSWTDVSFRLFDAREARAYVATGEPMDKAGGYGIQGRGAALVRAVDGDYYTVVGLPVFLLIDLLGEAGLRYRFGDLEPADPE